MIVAAAPMSMAIESESRSRRPLRPMNAAVLLMKDISGRYFNQLLNDWKGRRKTLRSDGDRAGGKEGKLKRRRGERRKGGKREELSLFPFHLVAFPNSSCHKTSIVTDFCHGF